MSSASSPADSPMIHHRGGTAPLVEAALDGEVRVCRAWAGVVLEVEALGTSEVRSPMSPCSRRRTMRWSWCGAVFPLG